MAFFYPIYPVPLGIQLGQVPVVRFSGEPINGLLAETSGAVFFSPSLFSYTPNNEFDLDSIQVISRATEKYIFPSQDSRIPFWSPSGAYPYPTLPINLVVDPPIWRNNRVFIWGGKVPPNNGSHTNDSNKVSTPKSYSVIGIMTNTSVPLPLPTTIFKVM